MATLAGLVPLLATGAWSWAFDTGAFPIAPTIGMLAAIGCAGATLLLADLEPPSLALVGWCLLMVAFVLTGFVRMPTSDATLDLTLDRVRSVTLIGAFAILMTDAAARQLTRWLLVLCVVVGAGVNVYEVTHPLTFTEQLGRSAGFHRNPNVSAAALFTSALLAAPVIPARWREAFLVVAIAGAATTLSRGAAFAGVLATIALCRGAIRVRRLIVTSAIGFVVAISLVGALLASGRFAAVSGGAEEFLRNRFSLSSGDQLDADVSASSRRLYLERSLTMFAERPVVGHGMGSTVVWAFPESTHNIYAQQLAEYGLAGGGLALVLFALLFKRARSIRAAAFAAVTPERSAHLTIAASYAAFALFSVIWGTFSHNLLDDSFSLVGYALVLATPIPRFT